MPFQLNNRLDIYDIAPSFKAWREASIVDIAGDNIKIHYRGFSASSDEWLNMNRDASRIMEVGSFSNAHGWAKSSVRH